MRQSWTDERLDEFGKRMDERFDRVDERFDEVDRRLDKIDIRLESIQATMDRRFDSLQYALLYAVIGMSAAMIAVLAAVAFISHG
jgi:tetrahydromethanopterin S-methyltransferase subunit G